jgi:hypothetical protein
MVTRCNKRSGGGPRGECGIDVDNPWPAGIEADRNLRVWVMDLDLPFTVQGERTWPAAKRDRGALVEDSGLGYRDSA